MRLLLTRHGETIENQLGLVYGHQPGVLSALGKHQIECLALSLRDVQIDAVYSSDLLRCTETTQAIVALHAHVPVYYTAEIREQDQGSYVGKYVREVDWNNLPPDIESPIQIYSRARKFLDFLISRHPSETVLVVSHRRFNNYLINVLLNRPAEYIDAQQMMYNAALSAFSVEKSGVELETLNDVFHLTPPGNDRFQS